MKYLARQARVAVGLVALSVVLVSTGARADGIPKDELSTTKKTGTDLQSGREWMRKWVGSSAEIGNYIGSGSFYTSGYSDPYLSVALFLRPTYDLGTRFKLSATARLYVETEYLTTPDLPNGRRFYPYDIWLWLSAKELHKFEASQIKVGGIFRVIVPFSYESLYSHMLTGLATGLNVGRTFEFGRDPAPERRFSLSLSAGTVFTKYIHTSELRGNYPGDSTGCRRFQSGGPTSSGLGGPTGSESDRCGGPVNTSYSFMSSLFASLTRGNWTLASILVVSNQFRYTISPDLYTPVTSNFPGQRAITADDVGQADTTWGILSLTYAFTNHLGASVGISSYQPAMDAQYRNLRFPFFDLSGGANANNYTQAFVSLTGTL